MQNNIDVGRLIPMITSLDYEFTKSEKKVSKIVINNPEKIIYSSITDLADLAEVGEATIIRFCRKLGFKGFQGFKMALAQELSMNKQSSTNLSVNAPIEENDSLEIIAKKFYTVNDKALKETLSLLDYTSLEKAAELVSKAERVYFFGVGFSGTTAMESKYKFMRIAINCDAYTDNHFMAMAASLLNPNDVVIGISHSGSSLETVKGLEIARSVGAKTICITHHAKSPITKHADITLLNGSKEGPLQVGGVGTKIAQLFVIDLIYTQVVRINKDKAISNTKKTREAIEKKLY